MAGRVLRPGQLAGIAKTHGELWAALRTADRALQSEWLHADFECGRYSSDPGVKRNDSSDVQTNTRLQIHRSYAQ
jgi:hypothetical protein